MGMERVCLYSCLFLALLLLPLVLLKVRKQANAHGGPGQRLPPGPWRLPVIGSLLHLLGKPHAHRAMADLARRHGDALLMYLKLGEVPYVVASSPDAAREILVTQGASFASRPVGPTTRATTTAGGGGGLASAPYEELLLNARRVRSFRRAREEGVARLLASVATAAVVGGDDAVNVGERADALVADATARAVIGDPFEQRDEFLEVVSEAGKLVGGFTVGDMFPSWRLARLFVSGTTRRAEAVHRKMSELMDGAIRHRQHQEGSRSALDDDEESILDVLLRMQTEGGYDDIPLTTESVKDIILDLFLAGTETTAATIQWAMAEMMRNPRILHKAQDELRDKLLGKPTVTEDELPGLSYLKLVIKETLRLHPASPMLVRECGESCKVLGYDVPQGATVLVNAWAIHRDPKHWADAVTFKPERFEDGGAVVDFTGAEVEFMPFREGRRTCPGVAFVQTVVELALAAMLYHFNWELPAGVAPRDVDMEEETGLVVRRKTDLYLHPFVRVPLRAYMHPVARVPPRAAGRVTAPAN